MFILVGKRHNLGLDARTVAGTYTLYLPIEKRRFRKSAAQYLVSFSIGVYSVARSLLKFT